MHPEAGLIVLDTNVVLDLLVFCDPGTETLRQALLGGTLQWIATAPMREELARVLGYRHIAPRLASGPHGAEQVLAQFDHLARLHVAAPRSGVTCADPDDQMFIDLALAHRATLLSKDQAVLRLTKRLSVSGVRVQAALLPAAGNDCAPVL